MTTLNFHLIPQHSSCYQPNHFGTTAEGIDLCNCWYRCERCDEKEI